MAKRTDMERIAKALNTTPETVRRGLEQGAYPFGTAVKCEKSYCYQFFPKAVERYLGIRLYDEKGS